MNKKTATKPNLVEAYNVAASAIFKVIATHEDYFETVILLASLAVCGSGHLSEIEARHNAGVFQKRLDETITEIMKLRVEPKTTVRLM